MRVANTEVGGLTGGLYEAFEALGLRFFRGLLGAVRAGRPELEYRRVAVGGTLVGACFGAAVGMLSLGAAMLAKDSIALALGCGAIGAVIAGGFTGGLTLLGVAGLMIYYVNSLRIEDVRSAAASVKGGCSFEAVLAERQKLNLDAGYPPKDALREAWWFARLTTGTVHTRQ